MSHCWLTGAGSERAYGNTSGCARMQHPMNSGTESPRSSTLAGPLLRTESPPSCDVLGKQSSPVSRGWRPAVTSCAQAPPVMPTVTVYSPVSKGYQTEDPAFQNLVFLEHSRPPVPVA